MSALKSLFGSLPIQGGSVSGSWDALYIFLVTLSFIFFVGVVGAMLYFAIKYKKGKGGQTDPVHHNTALEVAWTAIPLVLVLGIFVWGFMVYRNMVSGPSDSMEIHVVAKRWSWTFIYDDGRSFPTLYVPVNEPVKLTMTSETEDVLHSFFVPNFRIKSDVVPGMFTHAWFEATVPGEHQIFCTEYCGAGHSGMLAKLVALKPDEWANFKRNRMDLLPLVQEVNGVPLNINRDEEENAATSAAGAAATGGTSVNLAVKGRAVFQAKICATCHTVDGNKLIGPSFKGLFGSKVELEDGSVAIADENYIRESILEPNAKVVKGYSKGLMPTMKGQVSDEDVLALIAFIKTLK